LELVDQHTKRIMEGCKERARDAGLRFEPETLEYIVTNRDLLELGPKLMIPTLYDYWVHDVEVLKEKGKYELYPHNPYETVINTRPAISFYNDNNPDWLNVMIFYHVLAHVDFFQNNHLFRHTWHEDFTGKALSDKRLINRLRSEKGRWVDYAIEFTRGIDNLVGFFGELSEQHRTPESAISPRMDYYFDHFLQSVVNAAHHDYLKEVERYNEAVHRFGEIAESVFFAEVSRKHPEFDALFEKHRTGNRTLRRDLIQYIQDESPFLQAEENKWMKTVMQIVRNTSLFFQPQIRTRILNEGWASYWHEKLFLEDDRIRSREVDFARVNARITSLPRVGLNPYALGMRLFAHVEELSRKGRRSYEYQRIRSTGERETFDRGTGDGLSSIFGVREDFSDFTFINTFVDQDFVDRHRLFVSGKRLNPRKRVWEYYVKSRDAREYRSMLLESLYHPPSLVVETSKAGDDGSLYLSHLFEGKPLVREFIPNTMLGIEYLWGRPVMLETTERIGEKREAPSPAGHPPPRARSPEPPGEKPRYERVLYTMKNRKLSRTTL
jgi:stage V sporulation protein R